MPEDPVLCKMQYSVHIAKITSESTPPAMLRHARRRSCSTVNKGLSYPKIPKGNPRPEWKTEKPRSREEG